MSTTTSLTNSYTITCGPAELRCEGEQKCLDDWDCNVICNGDSSCLSSTILCPPNCGCYINCIGTNSCSEATIDASHSSEFTLNGCLFDNECDLLQIHCPPKHYNVGIECKPWPSMKLWIYTITENLLITFYLNYIHRQWTTCYFWNDHWPRWYLPFCMLRWSDFVNYQTYKRRTGCDSKWFVVDFAGTMVIHCEHFQDGWWRCLSEQRLWWQRICQRLWMDQWYIL